MLNFYPAQSKLISIAHSNSIYMYKNTSILFIEFHVLFLEYVIFSTYLDYYPLHWTETILYLQLMLFQHDSWMYEPHAFRTPSVYWVGNSTLKIE
jgi:hypothetical protein